MTGHNVGTGLQLQSTIRKEGVLELTLGEVPFPKCGEDDVVVRVEASPINPSDLGLLFGPADMRTAEVSGTEERPIITAQIPEAFMGMAAARVDQAMPAGNEGAGVVIEAGSSDAAQALLGKTVAAIGREMYQQYRCLKASDCLLLPEGTTPAEGASCFVNPLTVLGMVETMRMEGHTALVHTAAASNLGQMLQKLCIEEGVELVNIVRREEQETILRDIGAKYVVNSSSASFTDDLVEALVATGATIGFDATGGGRLAGQILAAMEVAANRNATEFTRYGSMVHKQVYIYGGLDRTTTELNRAYGMAWGLGGWLLTYFLIKIGDEAAQKLRERVAREIKTTFASHYTKEVSLAEMLSLESIRTFGRMATGEKYLVNPSKDS